MTFAEMQQEIQQTVGDTGADMLDHIKKAINLAYREMGAVSPQFWVLLTKTLTVSDGTQSYDLDATCRRVKRIRPPVDVVGKIRIVDNDAWNDIITDYDRAGTPVMAKIEDLGSANEMKIHLHPIPEAGDAGSYLYDAQCRPTDLSADADLPVFGTSWDACLMDGSRYELYKILGEDANAQVAHAAYMERFQRFAGVNTQGADEKGAGT